MLRASGFACLFLLICLAPALAQAPPDAARQMDDYLTGLARADRFSGSVLVAREGRVLLSKGYGMANIEDETPNTPQTKFRLGSITKQFTAMAILMLAEGGKLSISDPVCKYVDSCPDAWQKLSISHLLTHTSGIPNFTSFPEYIKTMALPATPAELVARFRDKPLDFPPGDRFNYSNSGYILLGYIIEKASGKTYDQFLQEKVFAPLHMTDTGYEHPDEIIKRRAAGYTLTGTKLMNAPWLNMTVPFAAGGLYSTVEDLYKWDQALYSDKLVPQAMLAAMFTPVKANYGYGLFIDHVANLKRISHGGGINGFTSFIDRYPEQRATVIVLGNNDHVNTGVIAARLTQIALADKIIMPATIKLDTAALGAYAGRYGVPKNVAENAVLDISVEQSELYLKPSNEEKHRLAAVSANEFYDVDEPGNGRFVFQRDALGNVSGLEIRDAGGATFVAPRLALPRPSLTGNTTFRLKGHPTAKVVALAGSFNDWDQSRTLCAHTGGEWVCHVDLKPGRYLYKFVIDGEWITDPENAGTEADSHGNINSVLVKN